MIASLAGASLYLPFEIELDRPSALCDRRSGNHPPPQRMRSPASFSQPFARSDYATPWPSLHPHDMLTRAEGEAAALGQLARTGRSVASSARSQPRWRERPRLRSPLAQPAPAWHADPSGSEGPPLRQLNLFFEMIGYRGWPSFHNITLSPASGERG